MASGFTFSHELYGEKFYTANIAVQRSSDAVDIIPAMFSERLIDTSIDCTDVPIQIVGQFRSYNQHEDSKTRLLLYIFVQKACLPGDTVWKGNCRCAACGESSIWQSRLYSLYCLGKKCKIYGNFGCRLLHPFCWKNSKQGIHKERRNKNRLWIIRFQNGNCCIVIKL